MKVGISEYASKSGCYFHYESRSMCHHCNVKNEGTSVYFDPSHTAMLCSRMLATADLFTAADEFYCAYRAYSIRLMALRAKWR